MPTRLGRILRAEEFSNILRNGTRTSHHGVVFAFCPAEDMARLGFAVGRAAGNAVHRNRFRRVIREHLRLQALPPVDIVVTVRATLRNLDNEAIRKSVSVILEKNGWLS